jgi:hypothetical protein
MIAARLRSSAVMPIRSLPRPGAPVAVRYLAATVAGTIERVDDDGRRVLVRTDDGEALRFVLNHATARFALEGQSWQARLSFA